MCGILGFVTDEPSRKNYTLFKDLLYISSARGTDATGFASFSKDSGRVMIKKEPVKASDFIRSNKDSIEEVASTSHIVIGHTRKWTQGKPNDNNNNHPIESDDWVMVHNGTCSSISKIDGYRYNGEVDSELYLAYIQTLGIPKGLSKLGHGSAAIALLRKGDPKSVFMFRHSEPTYLALSDDRKTIFFASTEEILREGLSDLWDFFSTFTQWRKSNEDYVYRISYGPLNLETLDHIEVEKSYTYSSSYYNQSYTSPDWGHRGGGASTSSAHTKETTARGKSGKVKVQDIHISGVDSECADMVWSPDFNMWVLPEVLKELEKTGHKTIQDDKNKYFFAGYSCDFKTWDRFDTGWISVDRKMFKYNDKKRHCHVIMSFEDAIKEGLVSIFEK